MSSSSYYSSVFMINYSNPYSIDIFSLCINPEHGSITLGGPPAHIHAGTIVYTPVVSQDFWTIWVEDVRVFGESIGVAPAIYNKGKAIVDDGTDAWYMPRPAWEGLRRTMEAHCDGLVGLCAGGAVEPGCVQRRGQDDLSGWWAL